MQELAKRIELVPLPLRFTMLADRAAAELERARTAGRLDQSAQEALRRVLSAFEQAAAGEKLTSNKTMEGYSSQALRAFRLTKRANERLSASCSGARPNGIPKPEVRIKKLLKNPCAIDRTLAAELSTFLRGFAKACFSLDTGIIEQVKRGQTPVAAG